MEPHTVDGRSSVQYLRTTHQMIEMGNIGVPIQLRETYDRELLAHSLLSETRRREPRNGQTYPTAYKVVKQYQPKEAIISSLKGSGDFRYREADPQYSMKYLNEKLEKDSQRETLREKFLTVIPTLATKLRDFFKELLIWIPGKEKYRR